MLASVLHSEVAIKVSIGIMRAFVEMRRFIANNALLFERISNVELKQLEYQKQTDEKLDQIFDAFSLIVSLIQKAEKEIVLIDGYVDVGTSVISEFYTPLVPKGHDFLKEIKKLIDSRQGVQAACEAKAAETD